MSCNWSPRLLCLPAHRLLTTLKRLQVNLAELTLDDPLDQASFDQLDEIRAKMRMIDVWLKGASGSSRPQGQAEPPQMPSDPGLPPLPGSNAVGARVPADLSF